MLTLREVGRHPHGARALQELRKIYVITEAENGLVFTQKTSDFRLFLYEMDDVLAAARRIQEPREGTAAQSSNGQKHRPDATSGHDDPNADRHKIDELEKRVAQFQAANKAIMDERDQWKRRAMEAAENLITSRGIGSSTSDKRYGILRRFLAKQFHPDHAPGSGIEKMIRSEVFKEIWTEIERIDAKP